MTQFTIRRKLRTIIFGVDTPAGRAFDVVLLVLIVSSVLVLMLESVYEINVRYGKTLLYIDWTFSLLFSIEYVLRIWISEKPRRYVFSFYGLIDLLAILPAYLSLVFIGSQALGAVRALRLLRIFRVLKLVRFLGAADQLGNALRNSRQKIAVFLFAVLIICVLSGALMYVVEGRENGFTSIPRSVYWSVVTLTTVGYGDIAPSTILGQSVATVLMITGYGIIAVPTGLVTAEVVNARKATPANSAERRVCENCRTTGHDADAVFCKRCGEVLKAA